MEDIMKRRTSRFIHESKELFLQIPYPVIDRINRYDGIKKKIYLYIIRHTFGYKDHSPYHRACCKLPSNEKLPGELLIKCHPQTISDNINQLEKDEAIFIKPYGNDRWAMVNDGFVERSKRFEAKRWEFSQYLYMNKGEIIDIRDKGKDKGVGELKRAFKKAHKHYYKAYKFTEIDEKALYRLAETLNPFYLKKRNESIERAIGDHALTREDYAMEFVKAYKDNHVDGNFSTSFHMGNYIQVWWIKEWLEIMNQKEEIKALPQPKENKKETESGEIFNEDFIEGINSARRMYERNSPSDFQ